MRVAAMTVVLLVSPAAARADATGVCPPCSRTWFEGTLQITSVPGVDDWTAIATGDFDRDGRADVAAAAGGVYVLLAHADGVFRRGPILAPVDATLVEVADMDGDGFLDVVAGGGGSLVVTRGNGLGGFLAPLPGVGAATIADLAIADLTADGLPDVAVVHGDGADAVTVFHGTGGGALALAATFPSGGSRPTAVAAGDFDRDGRVDLAVANNLSPYDVTVFRNEPSGAFAPQAYPIPHAPLEVRADDLDRDGDLDLAVAGAGGTGAGLVILHNTGTGAFETGPSFTDVTLSYGVATGDFDGDGDVDLAFGTNPIRVARRQPDGRYVVVDLETGASARSLAAADWNRDGRPDLAIGIDRGVLFVRPDVGQEIRWAAEQYVSPAARVIGGDFNEDGHRDVFVSSTNPNLGSALWLGDGALGLAATGFQTAKPIIDVADFNADGHADLVTWDKVLLGNGQGGFTPSAAVVAAAVGDFNRDGRLDLAGYEIAHQALLNVTVRLGDGAGGFGAPVVTPFQVPMFQTALRLVAGDFNGDGFADLGYTSAGTHGVLLGDGSGSFTRPPGGLGDGSLEAADLDQDGYTDLLIGVLTFQAPDRLMVRRGSPAGLGPMIWYELNDGGGTEIKVVDANGDGTPDVLAAHGGGGRQTMTLLFGGPGGTLVPMGLTVGWNMDDAAIGDWNGDGRPDLAIAVDSRVRFFPGTRCEPAALSLMPQASACPVPGSPLPVQPAILAVDAAGNATCPSGAVTATLAPGSGAPGAVLGGTTTEPFIDQAGIALFHDLSVDRAGRGYRLTFQSPGLVPVTGPTFSQGLEAAIGGSAQACPGRPETYDAGFGFDSYGWTLDRVPVGSTQTVALDLERGPHTLGLQVAQDACSASGSLAVTSAPPSVQVTADGPTTVCAACTGALLTSTIVASESAPIEWGYRTRSGGPITPLPGEDDVAYRLDGRHFPGPGRYFVVASVACGTTATSNEVAVTVALPPAAQEVAHGSRIVADLQPGPAGASRSYLLAREARTSYEVLVDGASGDVGAGNGPLLEHVAGDGGTVLASAQPTGTGPSRSLRIVNPGATRQTDFVRVTSEGCGSDCGADDVFTLRVQESTLRGSRFNNAGSQTTVIVLHNVTSQPVAGAVHFWTGTGDWRAAAPFALDAKALLVLQTASVPEIAGLAGSLTVTHDGPHGALAGKAVAIEPATGFSFDTPFSVRPR